MIIKNSNNEKEALFKGRVVKQTYNSEEYKIYALDVDRVLYPDIKFSKYGNAVICGEIHELGIGIEYEVRAVEQSTKYGYSYKVLNIRRDKPRSATDMYVFLQEILSLNQAETLYNAYPDIVDRVMQNRLEDIDFSKLKGIKEYTFNIIKSKIIENYCLSDLVLEFQGLLSLSMLKKLYDKYASITVVGQKMKQNPYKCLCGLARVGFITADGIILEIDKVSKENMANGKTPIIDFDYDVKTSPQRCLACIMYLLGKNEEDGHTLMSLLELKKQCDKLVPACSANFVECLKDENIYYDKSEMVCALQSTYQTEKYISDRILEGLKCSTIWDYDISKYRNINGSELSDEQMGVLKSLCKNQISILNGSAGCVDCDTEFFNGYEWKRIADYQEGEQVLQYNEDGTAELVYPSVFIKRKAEYLWHFETKYGLDQCLSENHNCYYITSKGNLYHKTFAEVKKDQELSKTGFKGKFITTFNYNGVGIPLSDDEIRIMVAVFTDGSFYNFDTYSFNTYNQVRFHIKKERKKQRLIKLLNKLQYEYRIVKSVADGYDDFYFNVPFRCKHFPKSWYNCNASQMKIISEEVLYWDSDYNKQNCFSTTSKNDADFIQFVFTINGYRTTISVQDRTGQEYLTAGKLYTRKSVEYTVRKTTRTLISLCGDGRPNHQHTPIEKYKTVDGYEYCFTVPSHILVLRRKNKIFITGNCGKSFATKSVVNMLDDNGKTYTLFAPTGKSAKVLSDFTKKEATTIHRGLGYIPPDQWEYNENDKLMCDVLIIDEFSMTDIFLFKRVLEAIDFSYTKLLLIGDNAQLPSVSCGNLLHDFMQSGIIPTVTLSKVFRYSEGGLMKVATDVRLCKNYLPQQLDKLTWFGKNKDYAFINLDDKAVVKNIIELYKKLLLQGYRIEDIQVLSSYKKGDYGAGIINNGIQKVANPNYGSENFIKVGETSYYQGDLIIQNVNNYHAKLFINNNYVWDNDDTGNKKDETFIANGETGIITEVTSFYVIINFDGIFVKYSREELQNVGLGYCITIHKSQGSSSKVIILVTPKAHTYMLNSNLVYVGLTRMREKCFHLGNSHTVEQSIKKKANFSRNTLMQKFLK